MKTYSDIKAVDQTISFETDPNFNHLVVTCTYFNADNSAVAQPTAGSIAIEGKVNGNSGWSALDLSPLDATDPTSYASTSIPLSDIRAVPTSIDVAVNYQITITANAH